MKGILKVLFLLVTLSLVFVSVPIASAEIAYTVDEIRVEPQAGDLDATLDSEPPDDNSEGDPDWMGDDPGARGVRALDGTTGYFDGMTLGEYLLYLLSQIQLLML